MTRKHLIGGTDAATLIGLGKTSPLMLYMRLRGEIPDDFEGNEATDAGLLFEDHVAVPAVRKQIGIELRRPPTRMMELPDEPRIGASFDFDVVALGSPSTGPVMAVDWKPLADIKLTGSRAMWGELDKVPAHVGAQMQMQMAVARANKRVVPCVHVIACFVPGFVMEDFVVEEDPEVGSVLLDKAREMIRRVDAGDPPTPGDEADARALFLGRRGQTKALSHAEVAMLAQLQALKAARKQVEDQEQQLRDALIPAIGDATELVHPDTGEVLATYRPNKTFDEAAFLAAHPAIAAQFTTFDRTACGKVHKKLLESFKREPQNASEAIRVLRIKGE